MLLDKCTALIMSIAGSNPGSAISGKKPSANFKPYAADMRL